MYNDYNVDNDNNDSNDEELEELESNSSVLETSSSKEISIQLEDLHNDAKINFLDYDIFNFARYGKYAEIELLLLNGLDPDSKDEFGNTILIIGAQNGNKRIVKLALKFGAQINMFNNMGNTALHFAKEFKYSELGKKLK